MGYTTRCCVVAWLQTLAHLWLRCPHRLAGAFVRLPVTRRSVRALIAISAVLGAACGGDSTSPEKSGPASISAVSTPDASSSAGATLSTPLVVRVTDAKGRPVAAAAVTFSVTMGNG